MKWRVNTPRRGTKFKEASKPPLAPQEFNLSSHGRLEATAEVVHLLAPARHDLITACCREGQDNDCSSRFRGVRRNRTAHT